MASSNLKMPTDFKRANLLCPKIIVTSHFRKGGKGGKHGSVGGLLKYMATRARVEKLPLDTSQKPAAKRQQDLISSVVKKLLDTVQRSEYQKHLELGTQSLRNSFSECHPSAGGTGGGHWQAGALHGGASRRC